MWSWNLGGCFLSYYPHGSRKYKDNLVWCLNLFVVHFFLVVNLISTLKAQHNMILMKDGSLFGFGNSTFGQLGLDSVEAKNTPVLVMKDKSIKSVQCGGSHTILLMETGEVWVFGSSRYGECGTGRNEINFKPKLLCTDNQIKEISCGFWSTIILKKNSEIWVAGRNFHGECGNSSQEEIMKFGLFKNDFSVKTVYCSTTHSMFLKRDGRIEVYGDNKYGILGRTAKDEEIGSSVIDLNVPILIFNGKKMIDQWSTNTHHLFSEEFKQAVFVILLCFKRCHKEKSFPTPPKFVTFEIIKWIEEESIHAFKPETNNSSPKKNSTGCFIN